MASKTTEPQDATDVLIPHSENNLVVIGLEPTTLTYIQKPLSFFGKLEVFAIIGGALDKAMSGPDGLTLSEIFDGPAAVGSTLNERNFSDADTFVKAISKLVQYAPDLIADIYLVALAVPRGERLLAKEFIVLPESEGGLSDEAGAKIFDTFIDQNWDVMVDFFKDRVMPLVQKVSNKVQESPQSKPLKTTQRTTQKA